MSKQPPDWIRHLGFFQNARKPPKITAKYLKSIELCLPTLKRRGRNYASPQTRHIDKPRARPVVKTLQEAHDASLLQDVNDANDPPLTVNENEEDRPTKRPRTEPQPDNQPNSKTTGESGNRGKVHLFVNELTEDEVEGPAISENMQTFLTKYSPVVLRNKPLSGEKKTFVYPQTANYFLKFVSIPRFGILLIPLADMTGKVSESLDSGASMPIKKSLSETASNFLFLVAAANHNLKICCRDLFKTDLDDNYNALCNNKHPIGSGLFGDELTKWLNTVTESNKAAKQLTRSTKASFQKYKGPPKSFLGQGVRK
ncbi:hypothetical protein ACROYT_G028395 [Oculina patagonica]